MKPKQVIIELQFSHLDLIVVEGGRIARSRRFEIALDSDPQSWLDGVSQLGEKLAATVEKFGLSGSSVAVLYSSPTQVVDLAGFAVRSPKIACDAANLRCVDSLPFSSLTAVWRTTCVGRDTGDGARQLHTVAAADREDVLDALVALTDAAGLTFDYALPITAAVLRKLAVQALDDRGGCRGRLYIGERNSLFAIADGGTIVFSRLINIGIDAIARSLTRPIERTGDEPIELNRARARKLLREFGIPAPDRVLDDELGLTAKQVLPLMQPVLQRFIVELRQSIRFGLSEQQRQGMSLHVDGPGSTLCGMDDFLTQELSLEVSLDPEYANIDFERPGAKGTELADVITHLRHLSELRLQPRRHVRDGQTSRLRQWLWAGASAAVLMVALDGVGYQIQLNGAQMRMKTIEGLAEQYERLEQNGRHLRDALVALNELDRAVSTEVGVASDLPALMRELTRLTPPSIRFSKVSARMVDGDMQVTFTGFAFTDLGDGESDGLESFMLLLRQSPLLDEVKLVNVQAGRYDERDGQRFDASCLMVPAAREDLWQRGLTMVEGATP